MGPRAGSWKRSPGRRRRPRVMARTGNKLLPDPCGLFPVSAIPRSRPATRADRRPPFVSFVLFVAARDRRRARSNLVVGHHVARRARCVASCASFTHLIGFRLQWLGSSRTRTSITTTATSAVRQDCARKEPLQQPLPGRKADPAGTSGGVFCCTGKRIWTSRNSMD